MKKITCLLASFLLALAGGTTASAQSLILDRSGWTVTAQHDLAANHGNEGQAGFMLDGNDATYWHSEWDNGNTGRALPQCFTVDLGRDMEIGGFTYLPRPDLSNGTVTEYDIYMSDTPYDVTASDFSIPASDEAVMSGTFSYDGETAPTTKCAIADASFSGRYLLFVARASNTGVFASCAEFNLLAAGCVGKTEAQIKEQISLYNAALSAKKFVDNVGLPGYPSQTTVAPLQQAVDAAFEAASSGEGMETAQSNLTSALEAMEVSAAIPTDVYFTLVNSGGRGAVVYAPEQSSNQDSQNGNAEYLWYASNADASNNNHLWAFIQNPETNEYYLYNVGKKQFANATGHGGYGVTWIFSNTPSPITLEAMTAPSLHIMGETNTTMSLSTGFVGPLISYYAASDGGVPFYMEKSAVAVDEDVTNTMAGLVAIYNLGLARLETAIANARPYAERVLAGLNNYTQPEGDDNLTTAINDANAFKEAVTAETQASEVTAWIEKLNTLVSNLVINQPQAGSFVRVRASNGSQAAMPYLTSKNTTVTDKTTCASYVPRGSEDWNDASVIFYYADGKLLAYETGLYLANNSNFAGYNGIAEGTSIAFEKSANQAGTYNVKFAGSRYLYTNKTTSDNKDYYYTDAGDGASGFGYDFWLEEVNELPVVVSEAGYATLYAPVALRIPADVQAFTGTVSGDYLVLTAVEGTIPANTPVIIRAAQATYSFTVAEDVAAIEANDLAGQVATGTAVAGAYTLQNPADGVGMYPYDGENLAGFKAYLPGQSGVKGFAFDFGNVTAIEGVLSGDNKGEAEIYDLSGRRVKNLQKGLYIVNGKKVLVK